MPDRHSCTYCSAHRLFLSAIAQTFMHHAVCMHNNAALTAGAKRMLAPLYGAAVTNSWHRSGDLLGPRLSLICLTHSTTARARKGSEELPSANLKLGFGTAW